MGIVKGMYEAPPQLVIYQGTLTLISRDIKWTRRARFVWWCLGWKYIPPHVVDEDGNHIRDIFNGEPRYSEVMGLG